MQMLPYFVIIPILVAVFLYLFPFEKAARSIAIVVQVGLTVATFFLFYISRGGEIVNTIGHYYAVLSITLRVDTLSAAFVVLTSFIFLMAAIYSYSDNRSRLFWFLLFLWEASLIGLFLTGDLFNIFVLSEVGTVVISVLIMYIRRKRSMYDGMIYLMINVVVMQFYVFGLGYVYMLTGVLDIQAVSYALGYIENSQLILPYALIMTFIALKCALVPIFSWLPKAHSTPGAPPAVSAVLSGLHIKSGVYLFLRVQSIFGDVAITDFFIIIGVVTAIVGIVMALGQTNIKLILAYSTVAQIGLIFIGLSYGDSYNYVGSLFHVFNHAIFKTALFFGAGMIIKVYRTKDVTVIRGVYKKMPTVAVALIFAILGIIGTPLFSGSISKYFLMFGTDGVLYILLVFINMGTITVFIKFATIFFGTPEITQITTKKQKRSFSEKPSLWQTVPVVILGVLCLMLGVLGEQFMGFMFYVNKNVSIIGYIEKSGIFIGSLIVAYLLYRYMIKDNARLLRLGKMEMGFKVMVTAIGVFFALVIVAVGFI